MSLSTSGRMRLKLSWALATAAWVCATCACACCSWACDCATCACACCNCAWDCATCASAWRTFVGKRMLQQLGLGHRLLRAGAGLRDGVAGGALVGAQLVLIEHGNQVAGLDPLPVVHRQAHDAAGDLAAHHHFVAIHGAGQHQRLRTRALVPTRSPRRWPQSAAEDRSFHDIHCKPNHCKSKLNYGRQRHVAASRSNRLWWYWRCDS